jgi:hypothetical protein
MHDSKTIEKKFLGKIKKKEKNCELRICFKILHF